jgi:urease accessory protein
MRVTHLDAQAVLFEVNALADAAYGQVRDVALEDMAVFAPVADVLAAVHVKSTVRMFIN